MNGTFTAGYGTGVTRGRAMTAACRFSGLSQSFHTIGHLPWNHAGETMKLRLSSCLWLAAMLPLAACSTTPTAAVPDREPDQYDADDVLLRDHQVPHVVVKEAFLT